MVRIDAWVEDMVCVSGRCERCAGEGMEGSGAGQILE